MADGRPDTEAIGRRDVEGLAEMRGAAVINTRLLGERQRVGVVCNVAAPDEAMLVEAAQLRPRCARVKGHEGWHRVEQSGRRDGVEEVTLVYTWPVGQLDRDGFSVGDQERLCAALRSVFAPLLWTVADADDTVGDVRDLADRLAAAAIMPMLGVFGG